MFLVKSVGKHNFVESMGTSFSGDLMESLVGEVTNDLGSDAAGAAGLGSAEAMLSRLPNFFWTWLS